MKLHVLDQYPCWNGRRIIICALLCLALSGCGSDDQRAPQQEQNSADRPSSEVVTMQAAPETEPAAEAETAPETVPSSRHAVPAAIQNRVELIPDTTAPQLKLDIPRTHLESLKVREIDFLHQPVPQKREPAKKEAKKLEIGGGIITDPEAAALSESVDGAKVKLDLKWD